MRMLGTPLLYIEREREREYTISLYIYITTVDSMK